MTSCVVQTPIGFAKIEGDTDGITSLKISDNNTITAIPEVLKTAVQQLENYFKGNRTDFNLKLNPQGTAFQQKVWKHLLKIPFGTTQSYKEIAIALGDENAVRAVANANSKNPIWIVIPCHRIIGSNGNLTGYAGGLHRKQWLLNLESPNKQQSLF